MEQSQKATSTNGTIIIVTRTLNATTLSGRKENRKETSDSSTFLSTKISWF
jgi:hypothetical protein